MWKLVLYGLIALVPNVAKQEISVLVLSGRNLPHASDGCPMGHHSPLFAVGDADVVQSAGAIGPDVFQPKPLLTEPFAAILTALFGADPKCLRTATNDGAYCTDLETQRFIDKLEVRSFQKAGPARFSELAHMNDIGNSGLRISPACLADPKAFKSTKVKPSEWKTLVELCPGVLFRIDLPWDGQGRACGLKKDEGAPEVKFGPLASGDWFPHTQHVAEAVELDIPADRDAMLVTQQAKYSFRLPKDFVIGFGYPELHPLVGGRCGNEAGRHFELFYDLVEDWPPRKHFSRIVPRVFTEKEAKELPECAVFIIPYTASGRPICTMAVF